MTDIRPLGVQISKALHARGVEVIFGIPGVHNVEMYRGIEEAGITHVLARHEQGAGFMADGYARASGKPGVAYVITGPGLTNIMTPMGQAYSDSVPMLVVSSCLDETAGRRGQLHQMIDQEAAAATVCDWSHTARTPDAVYGLIDRALAEFANARPRPKHIQVPIAALGADAPPAPTLRVARSVDAVPDMTQAANILDAARRPVFVFGGGARDAAPHIADLLARAKAASFTTYAGRGLVDPAHPLHFGPYLARPTSADVFASADLVIAVGTELAECDLWRPHLGHDCQTIRIDLDPGELSNHGSDTLAIHARAAPALSALGAAMAGRDQAGWTAQEVASATAQWRAESDAERPGIAVIGDALKDALPPETLIYSDMTQFAYVCKDTYPMDRPGHWHHPFGFGTLGYALPAAIGGKIAQGDKPVIAIAGDYGFHYTMQELGVAVELGLTLPIILWDNGKLMEIEASMIRSQIAPNAVVARNPDFCALAQAFGAATSAPRDLASFQTSVKDALNAAGPTLIYVTPDIV